MEKSSISSQKSSISTFFQAKLGSQISSQKGQISIQFSIKNSRILSKNGHISSKITQISGKNSHISGEISQISGKNSQVSSKISQISSKNNDISSKIDNFHHEKGRTRVNNPLCIVTMVHTLDGLKLVLRNALNLVRPAKAKSRTISRTRKVMSPAPASSKWLLILSMLIKTSET